MQIVDRVASNSDFWQIWNNRGLVEYLNFNENIFFIQRYFIIRLCNRKICSKNISINKIIIQNKAFTDTFYTDITPYNLHLFEFF